MEVSTQSTIQADAKIKVKNKKSTLISRLRENKIAYFSLWFLVLIHVIVFLGPVFWKVSPEELQQIGALTGWSLQHPFGTDDLGRDVFARMLTGGRVTLIVGLGAMLCSLFIGTIVGACAGFMGKAVEAILMRITEAMQAI